MYGKKYFHEGIQQATHEIWRGTTRGHACKNEVVIEQYSSRYIYTSKCTCPIVQEQMISYYNDIDLYMLNMVNSGLILRKQQQQH